MASAKRSQRALDAIRSVQMTPGFHRLSEGSVLYRAEGTVLLATASVEASVPDFLKGKGKGWITAEYQMHPRSNPRRREPRDGRERPLGGRTREIQRLIGRSLRAAVQLERLGERTVAIDCDVLEADGGTRTASITGGWVALVLALRSLAAAHVLETPALRDQVAAVSVGHVGGDTVLDLDYAEDSAARVDLNVVATARGEIVEIQGTAEGQAVPRAELDAMIDLALRGIDQLCERQAAVLSDAGVDLAALMIGPR
jgi:ribonuclease PH